MSGHQRCGSLIARGRCPGSEGTAFGALDEVERQLKAMSHSEIPGSEDLAWFIGAVQVEAEVHSADPLVIELEASRGVLRRSTARRTVTLSVE
jgi:hypothetical protein